MSVFVQTVQTADCKSVNCSLMTLSVGFHDPYRYTEVLCTLVSKARRHGRMRTIADTPRQPGLETGTSNMPASTCQHRARHRNMAKHQVSTTDKTRHQIGKPEQPNGPPDVALQYCKLSCCRMHSCCSKTLKHLKHASRCKRRTLPLAGNYNTIVTDKTIRQVIK